MANPIAIAAQQLSYRYDSGVLAIDNLSLQIESGQKVGIIGPNGAGKSTFLTLLNGLRLPLGRLEIFGHSVSDKDNLKKIRRLVGLVFQNPDDQLFMTDVFDDLAFGPRNQELAEDKVEQRVDQALNDLNSTDLRDRSTLQISFGQKKLIAIAGVLAMQPQLIALDEPTGNLDALHRRKLVDWVRASQQTIVITSHDLDFLWDTCSRIVLLNSAVMIADGTSSTILKDEKLLRQNQLELPLRFQI